MRFINSRELNINTSKILSEAQEDDLIITVRGKPAAILMAFKEEDLEDYILAKNIEKGLKDNPKGFLSEDGESLESLILHTEKELEKA